MKLIISFINTLLSVFLVKILEITILGTQSLINFEELFSNFLGKSTDNDLP